MISSKKINSISIILIIIASLGCFCAMLFWEYLPVRSDNSTGKVSFGDECSVYFDKNDFYTDYSDYTHINLDDIKSNGNNVEVNGKRVEILAGGTYVLTGTLADGYVVVNAQDGVPVRLVLEAAHITSSDFCALYIQEAVKTIITAAEGTVNILSDASAYADDESGLEMPGAAVFSRDDVTINGKGTITISGNYADAIKVNDGLKIMEGNIEINSVDDGINVNNYVAVKNGNIKIDCGGDGIKSGKETDSTKGLVALENGNITIHSKGDGIYTVSDLHINSAVIDIVSGGGVSEGNTSMQMDFASADDDASAKALKANGSITINNGNFTLNSADDALHSDTNITVNGGVFDIMSDDDAIHCESKLVLNSGEFNITKSNEGIEGGEIVINDGTYSIVASDDGINAVGINSIGGEQPMHMQSQTMETYLTINGGKICIEAGGDGLDSNALAEVNSGYIEVFGPENGGNSSLDFERSFTINGGTVIAAGNSGMAELPAQNSKINCVVLTLSANFSSGDVITLKDSTGNSIIKSVPTKRYNWICIADESIKTGQAYSLYINDENVGDFSADSVITSMRNTTAAGTQTTDSFGGDGMMHGGGKTDGMREGTSDIPMMQPTEGKTPQGVGQSMDGENALSDTQVNANINVDWKLTLISLMLLAAAFAFLAIHKRRY